MPFIWTKNDVATTSVTLYDTNITLNRAACKPFSNVRYVLLGFDQQNRQLAIKPVDKTAIEMNLYPRSNLHRLSLGKSYGRVSNKRFMREIADFLNLHLEGKNGLKYDARYDEKEKVMIVQL